MKWIGLIPHFDIDTQSETAYKSRPKTPKTFGNARFEDSSAPRQGFASIRVEIPNSHFPTTAQFHGDTRGDGRDWGCYDGCRKG